MEHPDTRLILKDGRPWIQVSALMNATPAQISQVITDYDHLGNFMPHLVYGKTLSVKGAQRKVRMDIPLLGSHAFSEIDVTEKIEPTGRTYYWEGSGGTIPINHGRWILLATGDGPTFVRYEIESYGPFPIPRWAQRLAMMQVLPDVLQHIDKRIIDLKIKNPPYFKANP